MKYNKGFNNIWTWVNNINKIRFIIIRLQMDFKLVSIFRKWMHWIEIWIIVKRI